MSQNLSPIATTNPNPILVNVTTSTPTPSDMSESDDTLTIEASSDSLTDDRMSDQDFLFPLDEDMSRGNSLIPFSAASDFPC